jgi:hypothetical protein
MKPALVVILSGALTFGVPLVIALWEVIVLRRGSRGGWNPDGPQPPEPPRPLPGEPPAQRPLPACLIPTRQPGISVPRAASRPRVLEPV